MGATDPKSIKEVLVYPVSSPTTMEEFVNPGGVVPSWQSRPVCNKVEAAILDAVIVETSKHLTHQKVLSEMVSMFIKNCSDKHALSKQQIQPEIQANENKNLVAHWNNISMNK